MKRNCVWVCLELFETKHIQICVIMTYPMSDYLSSIGITQPLCILWTNIKSLIHLQPNCGLSTLTDCLLGPLEKKQRGWLLKLLQGKNWLRLLGEDIAGSLETGVLVGYCCIHEPLAKLSLRWWSHWMRLHPIGRTTALDLCAVGFLLIWDKTLLFRLWQW
jgi:hypothetical protein